MKYTVIEKDYKKCIIYPRGTLVKQENEEIIESFMYDSESEAMEHAYDWLNEQEESRTNEDYELLRETLVEIKKLVEEAL